MLLNRYRCLSDIWLFCSAYVHVCNMYQSGTDSASISFVFCSVYIHINCIYQSAPKHRHRCLSDIAKFVMGQTWDTTVSICYNTHSTEINVLFECPREAESLVFDQAFQQDLSMPLSLGPNFEQVCLSRLINLSFNFFYLSCRAQALPLFMVCTRVVHAHDPWRFLPLTHTRFHTQEHSLSPNPTRLLTLSFSLITSFCLSFFHYFSLSHACNFLLSFPLSVSLFLRSFSLALFRAFSLAHYLFLRFLLSQSLFTNTHSVPLTYIFFPPCPLPSTQTHTGTRSTAQVFFLLHTHTHTISPTHIIHTHTHTHPPLPWRKNLRRHNRYWRLHKPEARIENKGTDHLL